MKGKIILLITAIILAFSCQQDNLHNSQAIKKGMTKVTILYPNGEGKKFDMNYYSDMHIPFVKSLFGDSLKVAAIDKGVSGGGPGAPITYLAIGYLYFESISTFQDGMKNHRERILADIPNYTNIEPLIQISEVIQ